MLLFCVEDVAPSGFSLLLSEVIKWFVCSLLCYVHYQCYIFVILPRIDQCVLLLCLSFKGFKRVYSILLLYNVR